MAFFGRPTFVLGLAAFCLAQSGCKSEDGDAQKEPDEVRFVRPDSLDPEIAETRNDRGDDLDGGRESDETGLPETCRFSNPREEQSDVVALYSFHDNPTLPYPSNLFTEPSPESPTGLELALGPTNTLLVDAGLNSALDDKFLKGFLNGLDGFSTFAPVLFALSGQVDLAALKDDPYSLAAWESPIILVEVGEEGQCGEPLPLLVSSGEFEIGGGSVNVMQLKPLLPLRPATSYAALLTRGLKGKDGKPVAPHPHFSHIIGCGGEPPDLAAPEQVERAIEILEPALSCLGEATPTLCPCDLAAATLFTTAANNRKIQAVYDFLHGPDSPPLNLSLDLDEDGSNDVCYPEELPFVPEEFTDFSASSVALRGAFDSPELRGDDLDVQLEDGKPVVHGTMTVPFVLMLPADQSQQPFKLVLMGHGHSGRKEYIAYLARRFGEQGVALAAIDAVGHGELAEYGKFLTMNVKEAHGSFVQSQANLLRFMHALQGLKTLDMFPSGGDGIADLDLNGGFGYVGESLGSLIGSASCSHEPSVRALVLNVVGGGFSNFAHAFLSWPDTSAAGLGPIELKMLVQNFVDDFDPISFALPLAEGGPNGAEPRRILMQAVIGDSAMDGPPTADLARALSLTYVCPCPKKVDFLPVLNAPADVNGLYYFDGAAHGSLLDNNTSPEFSDAARRQAAWFLAQALQKNKSEVIDPFSDQD